MDINGLITAKKGTGLNDLFKGYVPQQLEEIRSVKVERTPAFSTLMQKLEEYIGLGKSLSDGLPPSAYQRAGKRYDCYQRVRERYDRYLKTEVADIVSPTGVNALVHLSTQYLPSEDVRMAGEFFMHLVQQSYDAGYNDYYIDTTDIGAMNSLGKTLRGTSGRSLRITIDGPIGNDVLGKARNIIATIKTPSVPWGTAREVRKSTITIHGPLGPRCGSEAEYSSFKLEGKISSLNSPLGIALSALFCEFTMIDFSPEIQGNPWASNLSPFGCTFKTPNEKALEHILRYIPLGNRVIFIHPDKHEETLWKKHFQQRMSYKREKHPVEDEL